VISISLRALANISMSAAGEEPELVPSGDRPGTIVQEVDARALRGVTDRVVAGSNCGSFAGQRAEHGCACAPIQHYRKVDGLNRRTDNEGLAARNPLAQNQNIKANG
jgi:hypothetical protein